MLTLNKLKTDNLCCPRIGRRYVKDGDKIIVIYFLMVAPLFREGQTTAADAAAAIARN